MLKKLIESEQHYTEKEAEARQALADGHITIGEYLEELENLTAWRNFVGYIMRLEFKQEMTALFAGAT